METISVTFVGGTAKKWTNCTGYTADDTWIKFKGKNDEGQVVDVEIPVAAVLVIERRAQG